MQYRIISASSCFSPKRALERLTREVNEAIALGWEPLGGVAVTYGQFTQAMIKRR